MRALSRCLPFLCLLVVPLHASAQSSPPPAREARVTAVNAEVEIIGAARHNAAAGETLQQGQRIATHAGASAELRIQSAIVHVGDNTTLVMFAPATAPAAGQPVPEETTLVRGNVTVSVPESAGSRAFSIATRAAVVVMDGGAEVSLASDAAGSTRISIQRGVGRVRAAGREVPMRAGFGMRVERTRPPPMPRPLPLAPSWASAPPRSVLTNGRPIEVAATIGPSAPRANVPPAARWHIQVARDDAFTDRVLDLMLPARELRFAARQLQPGRYYARVAGMDGDRFEGPFSPVAPILIAAPHLVAGGGGRRAHVEIPPGFYCGLDGGPLAPSTGALWLLAARPHSVRCSANADGRDPVELQISAAEAGPIQHSIRIEPDDFDPSGGVRTVVLRLADGAGMPLAYANVRATANEGASIEAFREAEERGVYTATLHWRRGLNTLHLRFLVNDGIEFEEHRGVHAE